MQEKLIREIPLIERYSRHNEDEDYQFRAFLKGKDNHSNIELDKIVHETTDTVWKQIDCTSCANCCKTLEIEVDNKDIKLLAARLKISQQQFLNKYITLSEDNTKLLHSRPCVFLGSDNRCTVYEDRPQSCRDYPFLHEKDFRGRTFSMIDNNAVCPIVFNVWQQLKDLLGFRRKRR